MIKELRIGTAAWAIPSGLADRFPGDGSHLSRYARVMNASEINSSFHHPHRQSTYERWACTVPPKFAFSVKIPKVISHENRCAGCDEALLRFLDESAGLGEKRRLLLLQLPPSFAFEHKRMAEFFELCRRNGAPTIVCEPRHSSWFTPEADDVLSAWEVPRVAADPAPHPGAAMPGGCRKIAYFRMHGTPRTYYSSYSDAALAQLAERIAGISSEVWCIFDNTASGAALGDALRQQLLNKTARPE